jgi:hypothetical protein
MSAVRWSTPSWSRSARTRAARTPRRITPATHSTPPETIDTRIPALQLGPRVGQRRFAFPLSAAHLMEDIFDADALSVAVPYCDIVVPDKESRHLLEAVKAAARLNTLMPANVVELAQVVSAR